MNRKVHQANHRTFGQNGRYERKRRATLTEQRRIGLLTFLAVSLTGESCHTVILTPSTVRRDLSREPAQYPWQLQGELSLRKNAPSKCHKVFYATI